MPEARITIDDIRRAGHCVAGARDWLTLHGFEWRTFLKEGASEADILATGDAYAERVVAMKQARISPHG